MQLLQRGQSPASIRIVDFRAPSRAQMLRGDAAKIEFVQADITSTASVDAAFSKPWPSSVASLPLTVFHTAAAIRPWERSAVFWDNSYRVNVAGTANVVAAAKSAGADIFVATSSGSVAVVPVSFWVWPWRSAPIDYALFFDESDFDRPLRPASRFFANYAYSKAQAERLVCGANTPGFRTGCIRPANGVYGDRADVVVCVSLNLGSITSWSPHVVQNFVAGRNVALAHLDFEAALANTTADAPMPRAAGRPFVVTDDGPAPAFSDMYDMMGQLSERQPFPQNFPPPLVLLCVSYVVEWWSLVVAYLPVLKTLGVREPVWPVSYLQPSVFSVVSHTIASDAAARKSVAEGGIGYRPGCTSLEGMVDLVREWNAENREMDATTPINGQVEGKVAKTLVAAGLAPQPVAA